MASYIVTDRIRVNIVHSFAVPPRVKCEQYDGDYTKLIQAVVYNGDVLYSIPSAVRRIVVSGLKPDNTGFSYDCTWSGNMVSFSLMRQMTVVDGKVPCNITMFDASNNQVSSAVFVLDVEKAALPSDVVVSSNDFQTFVDYVQAAHLYSQYSKSYAVGNTGVREGENVDNAKYYAYLARMYKGSPLTASTISEMEDTERTYVYVGNESGYNNGHWYFYDDNAWVDGGVYNSQGQQTDTELITPDIAADAKAVGDLIGHEPLDTIAQTLRGAVNEIIRNKNYVTPEMFGAIGDGISDDTDAVSEAFTHERVMLPNSYVIKDKIDVYSKEVIGGTIEYGGSLYIEKLLDFNTQPEILIKNLTIEGNNLVGKCINIDKATARKNVVVDGCIIRNLSGGSHDTHAVIIEDEVNTCSIINNLISNMHNDLVEDHVVRGITITKLNGKALIENNTINGVITAYTQDADAIAIFNKNNTTANDNSTSLITNNLIVNSNGRCVKLQGAGCSIVHNNFVLNDMTMINTPSIVETLRSGVIFKDNNVKCTNLTCPRTKIVVVKQYMATGLANSKEIHTIVKGNTIKIDPNAHCICQLNHDVVNYPVQFELSDNMLDVGNTYAIRINASGINNKMHFKALNNVVVSGFPFFTLGADLIQTANAQILSDVVDNVSFEIAGNVSLVTSGNPSTFFSNTYVIPCKIKIHDNIRYNPTVNGHGWDIKKMGDTQVYFGSDEVNANNAILNIPAAIDAAYKKGVYVEGIHDYSNYVVVRLTSVSNTSPFGGCIAPRIYK